MKSIVFTIRTAYSKEKFFTVYNEKETTAEKSVEDFLCSICFCDDYEVISIKETKADTYYLVGDTHHMNGFSCSLDKLIGYTVEHEEAKIYYNSVLVWQK